MIFSILIKIKTKTNVIIAKTDFSKTVPIKNGRGMGEDTQKRCKQCSRHKIKIYPATYCPACPNELSLYFQCFLVPTKTIQITFPLRRRKGKYLCFYKYKDFSLT